MPDNKKTDEFGLTWEDAPPAPPPGEGGLAKLWRMATHPITETLGVNKAIDRAVEPGNEGGVEPLIKRYMDRNSATRQQAEHYFAMHPDELAPSGNPFKSFAAGAVNAVTPGDVASIVGLPGMAQGAKGLGVLGRVVSAAGKYTPRLIQGAGVIGSGLEAAQGATKGYQDAVDPNLSTGDKALQLGGDAGRMILGGLGVHGGVKGFRIAGEASAARKAADAAAQGASKTAVEDQLAKLQKMMLEDGFNPAHSPTFHEVAPDLAAVIDKNPAGKEAKVIWGEEGRPPEPPLVEQQAIIAKNKVAMAKAETQAAKMNADSAASDIQINEEGLKHNANQDKAKAKEVADLDKALYTATGASAKNEAPLARAEDKLNKMHAAAITEDERRAVAEQRRVTAGVNEASDIDQQLAINKRLAERPVVNDDAPIREHFDGVGPQGGDARTHTTYSKVEPEDVTIDGDEGGGDSGGGGNGPHTPPDGLSFWHDSDIRGYARDHKMSPNDWKIVGDKDLGYRFAPRNGSANVPDASGQLVGHAAGDKVAVPDEITEEMRNMHGKLFSKRTDAEAFRDAYPGSEIYQYGPKGKYRLEFPAITAEEKRIGDEITATKLAQMEAKEAGPKSPVDLPRSGGSELGGAQGPEAPYDPDAVVDGLRGGLSREEFQRLNSISTGRFADASKLSPELQAERAALEAKQKMPQVEVSDYEGGQPEHSIEVPPPGGGAEPPLAEGGYPVDWDNLDPEPPPAPKKPKGPKGPKGTGKSAKLAEADQGSAALDELAAAHGGELPQDLNPVSNGLLPAEPHVNPLGEQEPVLPGIEPTVNPDAAPVAEAPFTLVGKPGPKFNPKQGGMFEGGAEGGGITVDPGTPQPLPENLPSEPPPNEGLDFGGPEPTPVPVEPTPKSGPGGASAEPEFLPDPVRSSNEQGGAVVLAQSKPVVPEAPVVPESEGIPHRATHDSLAETWLQQQGQRGTPKQVAAIMKTFSPDELRKLLTENGKGDLVDMLDHNAHYGATHESGMDGIPRLKKKVPVVAEAPVVPDAPVTPETPEVPSEPQGGAFPARMFKSKLEASSEGYGAVKDANKAGERVPEEGRRIAAMNSSQDTNEFANDLASGKRSVEEIDSLPPKVQDVMWDRLKQALAKNNPINNSKGFGAVDPMLRMALGGLGASAGYKEDPLGNPFASALAGGAAGVFAPDLTSSVIKNAPRIEELGDTARNGITSGLKYANQIHNMGLLSPFSVGKKFLADGFGLGLAGLKNTDKAGAILHQLLSSEGHANIKTSFKNGWNNIDQQNLGALNLSPTLNSNYNPASWSGKTMAGLTQATKDILGESGFSAPEQRYYTLTDNPRYKTTQKLQELANSSSFMKHLIPFSKVAINRIERGLEYSPVGPFMAKSKVPTGLGDKVINATLGTGAALGAYELTPDDYVKNHPIASSMISAGMGPMGLPVMAAMALKNSHKQKNDSIFTVPDRAKLVDAAKAIGRDVPGLNLIQDIDKPEGFGRNYLAGYTNFMRPAALMQDLLSGETQEPDLNSKNLSDFDKLTNRMKSNVPVWRQTLPRK